MFHSVIDEDELPMMSLETFQLRKELHRALVRTFSGGSLAPFGENQSFVPAPKVLSIPHQRSVEGQRV